MSEAAVSPSDAIRFLYQVIETNGMRIVPAYVAQDLANVRRALPEDAAFSEAIIAIAKELRSAHAAPESYGVEIEHELTGWRRSKFPSKAGADAHLRIVFRPRKPSGMDVLAFGDRNFPETVYYTAKNRLRR